MPTVKSFELDGKKIDVEDSIARTTASNVSAQVTTLSGQVDAIKKLSRLSVSYEETTSTITFTTETHAS